MRNEALRCNSGESPSAPPITKTVFAIPVAPAAELPGETCAVDALAAFVERDQHMLFRDHRGDGCGLFGDARIGVTCAAFRNVMDIEAAKAELAADIVKARAITLGELPFRARFQTADADHNEAHKSVFRQSGNRFAAENASSLTLARPEARVQTSCAAADLHRLR